MTNQQQRDKAVEVLKQTTVGYQNKYWKVPPKGTPWDVALEALSQITDPIQPPLGNNWNWDATVAKVDPNSAAIVSNFVAKAGLPGYLNAGNAVVTASASDSVYMISTTRGKFDMFVHIPPGTKAGCDYDGHLGVKGPGDRCHDFYQAKNVGGKWSCNGGGSYDVNSIGSLSMSANAASIPQTIGHLTPEDLLQGARPHPLVLSVSPSCLGAPTRFPGVGQNYPGTGKVGLGMWFSFPPDIVFSGLPRLELTICRFIQSCGFFIRDGGDPLNVCALDCINRGGNSQEWGKVGVTLPSLINGYPYARQLSNIPWNLLEVLQPPV